MAPRSALTADPWEDEARRHPSLGRAKSVGAAIPTRSTPRFDEEAYRRRSLVERAFGRLKHFRMIAALRLSDR